MQRRGSVWPLTIGLLVSAICGCTTLERTSGSGEQPYLLADGAQRKALQSLGQKQDRLLKGCTKPSSPCEQLLYERALVALFESQAHAIALFQQAGAMPAGSLATVSQQWLTLLQQDPSTSDPTRALLSQYVIRELLERDTRSAQLRMKAQDKRIDELTRQLELLKEIEQQRPVHDLPMGRGPGP